jgi:hypothetical protein
MPFVAQGKRTIGRSTPRREDNITMDIRKIVLGGMDWIYRV